MKLTLILILFLLTGCLTVNQSQGNINSNSGLIDSSNPLENTGNIKKYKSQDVGVCKILHFRCLIGEGYFFDETGCGCINNDLIHSYEDCVSAGYAILKSNPPQCVTSRDERYVQGKGGADEPVPIREDESICIQLYDPYCGQIDVQCIKAPCPSIWQTFTNDCYATIANAKNLKKGTCEELNLN